MKNLVTTVVVAFVSAVCGAIIVIAFQSWQSRQFRNTEDLSAFSQGTTMTHIDKLDDESLGSRSTKANQKPFDEEETDAQAIQYIQEQSEKFSSEPLDTSWAEDAKNKLREDLLLFNDANFLIKDVDCRSVSCRALLEFKSYEAARKQATELAGYSYTYNCSKEVFTPQVDVAEASYQATLYLNCKDFRTYQKE
jgi:hypothetical protein